MALSSTVDCSVILGKFPGGKGSTYRVPSVPIPLRKLLRSLWADNSTESRPPVSAGFTGVTMG